MKKRQAWRTLKGLLLEVPALLRLVYRLIRDPRVSAADKGILAALLVYALNPLDLLPDALPLVGQVDDLYLLALGLLRLLNRADPEVIQEHWSGGREILPLLRESAELAGFFLPRRVRRLLLGKIAEEEKISKA